MFHRPNLVLVNATKQSLIRSIPKPSSLIAERASSSSSTSTRDSSAKEQGQTVNTETNRSFKPYIPLYHHRNPSLFPPLIPGSLSYISHNVSAAFQALASLALSQELRDKFISIAKLYSLSNIVPKRDIEDENNLYNGCIINTNVVGQTDMGLINVFSLFDGLSSPLFDMEGLKFDIKEFMDGAGFALEQFHKVDRDFFLSLKEKGVGKDYVFVTVAKSDPDSLEYTIMKMTTPPFWTYLNTSLREYFNILPFLKEMVQTGTPAESKITQLALLSARVAEIEKPMSDDNKNQCAPLEDGTYPSTLKQIITQLEVLYEREIYLPPGIGAPNDISSVFNVATFEACLLGDPNGDQPQWRLCQTRPASEFSGLL
ncbi:hypothetical protein ACHAW6_011051 [Cyclotella cf. meneghiniana]